MGTIYTSIKPLYKQDPAHSLGEFTIHTHIQVWYINSKIGFLYKNRKIGLHIVCDISTIEIYLLFNNVKRQLDIHAAIGLSRQFSCNYDSNVYDSSPGILKSMIVLLEILRSMIVLLEILKSMIVLLEILKSMIGLLEILVFYYLACSWPCYSNFQNLLCSFFLNIQNLLFIFFFKILFLP